VSSTRPDEISASQEEERTLALLALSKPITRQSIAYPINITTT